MKTIRFYQTMQVLCAIVAFCTLMCDMHTHDKLVLVFLAMCCVAFFQLGIKYEKDEIAERNEQLLNDLYERGEGEHAVPIEVQMFAAHMNQMAEMFQFAHNQHVQRKLKQFDLHITDSQKN